MSTANELTHKNVVTLLTVLHIFVSFYMYFTNKRFSTFCILHKDRWQYIFCNVYNLMSPTTTINDMKYENILHDLDPLLLKILNQSILNKAENMSYWHK